jgi:hypothetical protein
MGTTLNTKIINSVKARYSNEAGIVYVLTNSKTNIVNSFINFSVLAPSITLKYLPITIVNSNNFSDSFKITIDSLNNGFLTEIYLDLNGNNVLDSEDKLLTGGVVLAEDAMANIILIVTSLSYSYEIPVSVSYSIMSSSSNMKNWRVRKTNQVVLTLRKDIFEGENDFMVFPTILDLSKKETASFFYRLEKSQNIKISIYDLKGDLVAWWNEGFKGKGEHKYLKWNGENHAGRDVAVGMYFVSIEGDKFRKIRKIIVIK